MYCRPRPPLKLIPDGGWRGEEDRKKHEETLHRRASSRSADARGGRTSTWKERISCLVKFHGTMDGTRVAVCNLQPSFNQYSRYTGARPRRFPDFRKLDGESIGGILQTSYVDRSESAEALLSPRE